MLLSLLACRGFGFRRSVMGSARFTSAIAAGPPGGVLPLAFDAFNKIMGSKDTRSLYQIIDVREPTELAAVKLKDEGVLNLPLGDAADWSVRPLSDFGLDASKPTVCVCKIGMRSMKVAQFLVTKGCELLHTGLSSAFGMIAFYRGNRREELTSPTPSSCLLLGYNVMPQVFTDLTSSSPLFSLSLPKVSEVYNLEGGMDRVCTQNPQITTRG